MPSILTKKSIMPVFTAVILLFVLLLLQSCTDSGKLIVLTEETPFDGNSTNEPVTPIETQSPISTKTPDTSLPDTTAQPSETPTNTAPPTATATVTPEATETEEEKSYGITVSKKNNTDDVINGDEAVVGTVNYSLPTLKSDGSLPQDIILAIENAVSDEINALKEKYKTRILFYSLDSEPQNDDKYYYTISFSSYLSGDCISFKVTSLYEYSSQSRVSEEAYVYSLVSGKKLGLTDLGISTRTLAEEAIDATVGMRIDFADDYRETIRNSICSHFCLDGENIILIYDECIIAPEIYGAIEISVPLKSVKN